MRDPLEAISRLQDMKAERSPYESQWQKIAELIRPLREEFETTPTEGARRGRKIYDATGIVANDNLAAGIYGAMTSPGNRWFALKTRHRELDDQVAVKQWLEAAGKVLLDSFGTGVSKFYNEVPALYADVAAFGTAVHFSAERAQGGGIFDSVRPLSECFIAVNEDEEVDTLYREFTMTARQLVGRFGSAASTKARELAERSPGAKIKMLHVTEPNPNFTEGAMGQAGKAFRSAYIELDHRHLVDEGGFDEFPYQVPRWALASGELYGRGRGEQALADLLQLQQMVKTNIRAGQMVADPPLLGPDEGLIKIARLYPSGYTPGGVSRSGRQLVHPLSTGGNVPLTFEMIQDLKSQIRESFYASLLLMSDQASMTATEVMQRQEEKMRLLGPNLGRIQAEFLSPLIKRRFGMLVRAGDLPPPPPELDGQQIEIDYVSPLARQQRTQDALTISRALESVVGLAQIRPEIADLIDFDEAFRRIADGHGAPAAILKSRDEVEQIRAERKEAQAQQQALNQGEQGAGIAQQLAGALGQLPQGGQ